MTPRQHRQGRQPRTPATPCLPTLSLYAHIYATACASVLVSALSVSAFARVNVDCRPFN